MFKKLFYNTLIYTVGPQIPKIASLFVLPITTKYLTPEDYGILGVISAYTLLFGAIADLGFGVVLGNSFYKYTKNWILIWRQIHGILSVWSLIFASLLGLVLMIAIPKEAHNHYWLIIALYCIPAAFFNITPTIGSRYYQFSQKAGFVGITSAITGVFTILCNLYTIAYLKMGYMGWFVSSFASSMLAFLFYIYPVYFKYKITPIFLFKKHFLKRNLKVTLPTIPHNYSAYLLNSSDRLALRWYNVPLSALGNYNLAYVLGNYFEFIGQAIGIAVGPAFYTQYAKKTEKAESDLKLLTFILQSLFIAAGFIISLWAREIFLVLIKNNQLRTAYPLAIIIIMGYVYRPMYWTVINRLSFFEKTNVLWRISFIAGVINLGLNLIFIPMFGVITAAVTTYVALMYLGFSGFYLKDYIKIKAENYYPIFWLSAIMVFTVIAYLLKDISWVYKTSFSVLLIFILGCVAFVNKKRLLAMEI